MRFHRIIVLMVVLILVVTNSCSSSVPPDRTDLTARSVLVMPHPLAAGKSPTSAKRFLRSYESAVHVNAGESEERVETPGLPAKLAGVVSKMFRSSSSNQEKVAIQGWLQANAHPQKLFNTLQLGKTTARLDTNTDFLLWFRYAAAYRAKEGTRAFSDMDMYYLLLKASSANDVEKILQSFKGTPGLKKLVNSIHKSLSGSWIIKSLKSKESPTMIFERLHLERAGAKLDESPIFYQWLKYVDIYCGMKGDRWFNDIEMLGLFRKTMPEENVVTLVHYLRRIPGLEKHADTMQGFIFAESKTSHNIMSNVWLKTRESPKEVYNILQLTETRKGAFENNERLFQWLRYAKLYRDTVKDPSFHSDTQLRLFLERQMPLKSAAEFASLYQVIKEVPDLKTVGESMQISLFTKLMRMGFEPKRFDDMLADPFPINVIHLPKSDPRYRTLEDFTLLYAKLRGGESEFKTVKTLFASGNPIGALSAAGKTQ